MGLLAAGEKSWEVPDGIARLDRSIGEGA